MLNRPATSTQITHAQRLWLYVLVAAIVIFLIAPTLIVIPISFSADRYMTFPPTGWSTRWYESFFKPLNGGRRLLLPYAPHF